MWSVFGKHPFFSYKRCLSFRRDCFVENLRMRMLSAVTGIWFCLLVCFPFQLDAPLFVTWFQCVVCLVCLFLLSFLGEDYPWIDKFPAFSIDLKVARQVGITAHNTEVNLQIILPSSLFQISLLPRSSHYQLFLLEWSPSITCASSILVCPFTMLEGH